MGRIMIDAPAKVNLFLAVGDRRPDGYHDLITVFQTLAFGDTVELDPEAPLSVVYEPDLGLPPGDDLVSRAASALAQRLGRPAVGAFTVRKRIPEAAGLGGGSSDAAAALVGLASAWDLALDDPALTEVAASIGADVPFFLRGGTALYTGRGDVFAGRLPTPALDIVLINPRQRVSTPAVYASFDRTPTVSAPSVEPLLSVLVSGGDVTDKVLFNDFSRVTIEPVSSVSAIEGMLASDPGVGCSLMSGSGPTVFGVCYGAAAAQGVVEAAKARGWWAEATTTSIDGVRVRLGE